MSRLYRRVFCPGAWFFLLLASLGLAGARLAKGGDGVNERVRVSARAAKTSLRAGEGWLARVLAGSSCASSGVPFLL